MTTIFPKELSVRAPTMDDLEAITDLIVACDMAEFGESDTVLEDVRSTWQVPDFDLDRDAWVVAAPGGQLVGYALLFKRATERLHMDVSVHPGFYGRGIGTGLTRLAEARTRELSALPPWTALGSPGGQDGQVAPPAVQVSLNSGIVSTNEAARQLLEEEGFSLIRHFLRMQIDMNGAPPEVSLPDGMTLRSLVPGRDEYATFTAMEEAFQDHWGYLPWHFETWQQLTIQRADFDPSLWFLAIDGDQIAGGALCYNFAEEGWVNQLAVRRAWRNQGLGLALLCHSFREFYERDQRRVSLQVDSQNTSGATRLYQRAGMHIVRQFDLYQKVVGGGEEHP